MLHFCISSSEAFSIISSLVAQIFCSWSSVSTLCLTSNSNYQRFLLSDVSFHSNTVQTKCKSTFTSLKTHHPVGINGLSVNNRTFTLNHHLHLQRRLTQPSFELIQTNNHGILHRWESLDTGEEASGYQQQRAYTTTSWEDGMSSTLLVADLW